MSELGVASYKSLFKPPFSPPCMSVFTLSPQALVPGHWHKLVLHSETVVLWRPKYHLVLSTRTLYPSMGMCQNSGVSNRKKGVFTLVVTSESLAHAPYLDIKCERGHRESKMSSIKTFSIFARPILTCHRYVLKIWRVTRPKICCKALNYTFNFYANNMSKFSCK